FSEATRLRVESAAKSLDYRPNHLARSLRMGRTKAIGVVVSNILSYHWTTFIRSIEAAASERGYQVILGTTADDPETELAYLRTLQERNVDGIILSPSPMNEPFVMKLIESGLPMVLLENYNDQLRAPRINIDDRAAAAGAVRHLIDLGHDRIGIVAGNQALLSGRDRLQGYRDALTTAGLPVDESLIGVGNYRFDPAYQATERLLSLREPPTALLVCNELMTGAALQCLKDRGVSLPDEVSLVAFDDPAWTSFFRPGITTVRTPRTEIAQLALRTLLTCLHDPTAVEAAASERLIPTELVIRESAVPPRVRNARTGRPLA
ncbi:MAG TPA: LacI family DNA-binding transcriptional regulator, partial [Trueperaceae bacterium]|nr:LacI family DNA-binding transcriptional regulator [Trueperaceae bacterium]